ncbi:MAG TPA: 3-methyl-2-oxobutanoate hydroxymethyltransferase [archaeon]|nr:3-methyl-2-oxobutanoate hydroxymethyltransferase [archaeon]
MNKFNKLKEKKKLAMLTAYDFQTAKILGEAGIDLILVGDSLGMVFQGNSDTKSVSMNDMLYHCKAVARGVKNAVVVGDMPINSYNNPVQALNNAKKFIEAGCDAVKVEGNKKEVMEKLIENGIPVMGHLGLLPQTAEKYSVQGKTEKEAQKIFNDAMELEKLGVFALVLECIPSSLAKKITQQVRVPTIGIGAGLHCKGQVLVINDLLGLNEKFNPRFVKKYLNLNSLIKEAVSKFKEEVEQEMFPSKEHSFE